MGDGGVKGRATFVVLIILMVVGIIPYFFAGLVFADIDQEAISKFTFVHEIAYVVLIATNLIPVVVATILFGIYIFIRYGSNARDRPPISSNKLMVWIVLVIYLQLGSCSILTTVT